MADEMAELHRTGRQVFAERVAGGEARLDTLFAAAPGLAELAVGVVYGHLHARPALDPRMREATALAAIVAAGMVEAPLAVHVRTGLSAGLTPAEISEILVETAAFAGFPRAVSAATTLPDLFTEAGSPVPPEPAPREILLDALAAREHEFAGLDMQVLTIGPGAAIAIFSNPDGSPAGVAHARTEGRSV
ncbi:MAG TPA: carboxymuconolactone decarboxylase family protein, partial [Pseudonocardiaceae bacterium]